LYENRGAGTSRSRSSPPPSYGSPDSPSYCPPKDRSGKKVLLGNPLTPGYSNIMIYNVVTPNSLSPSGEMNV
jgi:hypothetical protein